MVIVFSAFVLLAGWFAWSAYQVPAQRPSRAFPEPAARYGFGKALVVCYSSGGNTVEVARRICAMTGGELLELETQEPYPAAPMLYVQAKRELNAKQYPALKTALPDLAGYDVVFVGSPVWWGLVSPPTLAFLAQSDFGGRPVIPFCTLGGGSEDLFFLSFAQEARNAQLMHQRAFARVAKTPPVELDQKIASWLDDVQKELRKR